VLQVDVGNGVEERHLRLIKLCKQVGHGVSAFLENGGGADRTLISYPGSWRIWLQYASAVGPSNQEKNGSAPPTRTASNSTNAKRDRDLIYSGYRSRDENSR
jgi:hypothetical protein